MNQKIRSFSGKLTRRVVVVVLLTFTVVFGFILLFTMAGMTIMVKDHYRDMLELTNEKVERMLTAVEVSAVNNVDAIEHSLSNPTDMVAVLEKELRLNPHIIGCGAAFKPGYYPAKGKWYEPYVARREGGVMETRQIGGSSHDYFQSEWYRQPMETGRGYWSDPYYDEAGAKATLCTYSMPLRDKKGDIVGVFGADVSLEWLTRQMKEIDVRVNEGTMGTGIDTLRAYSFILGRNGNYIAHPNPDFILLENYFDENSDTPSDTAYVRIGKEMLAGKAGNGSAVFNDVPSYVFYAPLARASWSMAIVVPRETALVPGAAISTIMLFFVILGLLAVILVCRRSIRRATNPLRALAVSADEVAKGHFDTRLPRIADHDEIRLLRDSFENMQQSLSQYVAKLKDSTARQASLDSELSIAKNIQMSMLPKTFPPYPERKDVDIYARLTPAKAVGGDLYDFFIRDGKLFFCIGDVSGKGVPASLVMAMTSTEFRALTAGESRPDAIMTALNASLSSRNESMMFVTLLIGVLDLATGELLYCNAGHDAPIQIAGGQPSYLQVDANVAIGIEPDWKFTLQRTTLPAGTMLLMYTDGLTEAENSAHELFGEQLIFNTLREKKPSLPQAVITDLSEAVRAFVGAAEQSDDLTMLVIRYTPE